jgi:hypothetical protein
MTIVCVTHTLANIAEYADTVIVMGEGGLLTFCGAPADLKQFFSIGHLGEVFAAIDKNGAEDWRQRFAGSAAAERVPTAAGRSVAPNTDRGQRGTVGAVASTVLRQFLILTSRNIALLAGDVRSLYMALIQSVAIGALLGFAFADFGTGFMVSSSRVSFLLVLGVTCLWIGCAGAAKDIVGELPIYVRERDINLSTLAFVCSKFVVTGLFAVVQVAILMAVCSVLAQEIPGSPFEQFLLASLAAINGAAIGLVISSVSNSRDQAAIIVPLALAPQLIFGSGLVANLSDAGQWLAKLVIGAYWTKEAMTAALISSVSGIVKLDPAHGGVVAVTAQALSTCVMALASQTLGWLVLTIAIMYVRYARKPS